MPPRWPRGRTSRRFARIAAVHSRSTSHTNRTRDRDTLKAFAKNARYPGFARVSASIRLTVRITASASPDRRLPRLAPPSTSSPFPVARSRSIRAQSSGAEQVIIVPVSFSTQRNAGMSWFEPSRMPAWLAPVCDDRSGSHSMRRCVSSLSQRAMFGALPSRIARRRTGNARPSISRKMIPGASVRVAPPCRRAMRWTTRSVYVSSSFAEKTTSSTTLMAASTRAASSAHQNESTVKLSRMSAANWSRSALTTSASRNPNTSVSGNRSAASNGGRTAFNAATTRATRNAPPASATSTPGRIAAAAPTAIAVSTQETISRSGLTRRRSGCQLGTSPYSVISDHRVLPCRLAEPFCAELRNPLLGLEIDVDEPEPVAEAVHPLEVVLGDPEEVTIHRNAVRDRRLELREVRPQEHHPVGVIDAAAVGDDVRCAAAVLGDEDRRRSP